MRSLKVIPSGVSRLDGLLQPTQHGAASNRRVAICVLDAFKACVALTNRLGLAVWSFKQRAHDL